MITTEAQTSLGLIVGRGDVGPAKAGEEEFLFLAQEALAKALGAEMAQGGLTDLIELVAQALAFALARLARQGPWESWRAPGRQREQTLHLLAKLTVRGSPLGP